MTISLLILDDELSVDDNPVAGKPRPYMWYYVNALAKTKKDLSFQVATSVDEAKDILSENLNKFDFISIDIIMAPTDDMDADDVQGGTCTGIFFLKWLIEEGFSRNVIILTQRAESTVKALLPSDHGNLARIDVFEKMNTTPYTLIDKISEIGKEK